MKTMTIDELTVSYPIAAKEWKEEACQRLDGQEDEDEIDDMIKNSYFTIDPVDGAIIGDGIQAYTKFIWYPGVSTSWREIDQDVD